MSGNNVERAGSRALEIDPMPSRDRLSRTRSRTGGRIAGWLLAIAALGLAPAAQAAGFPPVTEAEKQLTEVPGSPEAHAVMLGSVAEFWMMDLRNQRPNSTIHVWRRLKVLTPAGAEDYGEVQIRHSRQVRLSGFAGRTVRPDGTEVAVDKDARFRQVASRTEKEFVTSVAFPNVEPGAILDWSYDLSFDSLFYLEPWFFQDRIPVRHSEVIYHIPDNLSVGTWGTSLADKPFQTENAHEKDSRRFRIWLDDLPAIPDEPFAYPDSDLMARFMLVPKVMAYLGQQIPLMDTWKDVCQLVDEQVYLEVGKSSKSVKRQARALATEAGGSDRRKVAEAIYRFVRDDLRSLPSISVFPRSKVTLDEVLEKREGNNAEKALLLRAMLEAVDLPADLLWLPNRWDGGVDPNVPNPGWFEKAAVRVHIPFAGGEEVAFLDPSDPRLGFGYLNPSNEGVPALVYDKKDPQVISIPESPASLNHRRAEIELRLDADGRLSGRGTLELTGHHAWARMSTGEDRDKLGDAWKEWLDRRWEGFRVDGVEVEEDRPNRRVEVRWKLTQPEEEVLGDEASVQLSRPLGPVSQAFQLEPEKRKTPVLLSFGDVDEVETQVTWPAEWKVEAVPKTLEVKNAAGVAAAHVEMDPEAHTLTFTRNMTVAQREFTNSDQYRALRTIYRSMEKSDAQALVLVAP